MGGGDGGGGGAGGEAVGFRGEHRIVEPMTRPSAETMEDSTMKPIEFFEI